MRILRKILHFFQGLRGRLILTYTLTTVLALLALEIVFLSGALVVWLFTNDDHDHYLYDINSVLVPQARTYLQPERRDLAGLQAWLDSVYDSGLASEPPQYTLDSPAAPLVRSEGLYVLAPDQTILAYAPRQSDDLIGQRYTAPESSFENGPLAHALDHNPFSPYFTRTRAGDYRLAIPVFTWIEAPPESGSPAIAPDGSMPSWQAVLSEQIAGVIVLTVEPPPPLYTLRPTLVTGLSIVLLTGLGLLAAVTPFGALFGFIMSRSLTRRLADLTRATDSWSEGDFSVVPKDRGRDEIGLLSLRLRHMAERIQALLQSQQELALMEERNRLARDLHDTVKQQNFATLMQLRAAKNRLETDPAEVRTALEQAESLVKAAQQDLGLIIAELRPAMLEGQGLPAALNAYLNTWSQHTRIPASFEVEGERSLPLNLEQTLYRVAQEALSNVSRHSAASHVSVRLAYSPDRILMVIHDNGQGFDPKQLTAPGFGLESMKQRLTGLGGTFEIHSKPEQGASVFASLPLIH